MSSIVWMLNRQISKTGKKTGRKKGFNKCRIVVLTTRGSGNTGCTELRMISIAIAPAVLRQVSDVLWCRNLAYVTDSTNARFYQN